MNQDYFEVPIILPIMNIAAMIREKELTEVENEF